MTKKTTYTLVVPERFSDNFGDPFKRILEILPEINKDWDEIIVDFKKPIGIEIIDLTDELEKLLKHKVDLVAKNGIEKGYYKVFRKEILYI